MGGAKILILMLLVTSSVCSASVLQRPSCQNANLISEQRARCWRPWTVLVFMDVSPDLEKYAEYDLQEMQAVGSGDRADFVVAMSGAGSERRFHVEKERSVLLTEKTSPPGQESFTPEFKDFLKWGVHQYPANHFAVVTWGHGRGWVLQNSEHILFNVKELKNALESILNEELQGRRLDAYISDACYMQSAEVVAELAPTSRFLIGSAQAQPYIGLPYRAIMDVLNSGDLAYSPLAMTDEVGEFVRFIPTAFKKSMTGKREADWISLTAVETDQVGGALLPALKDLGQAFSDLLQMESGFHGVLLDSIKSVPSYMGGIKDLGKFIGEVDRMTNGSNRQNLEKALFSVKAALARSVRARVLGSEYDNDFAGISVWLPEARDEYFMRSGEFQSSSFYKQTGWDGWLRELY